MGAYDSADGLDRLARSSDVVTFEFESVPAASAERLAGHVAVQPPPAALEVAQDRLHEKRLFAELGIETAPFRAIGSQAELDGGPLPGVLKTRRLGYDGKGQRVLREAGDAEGAFAALGEVPLILEGLVEFDRELSIVAVRAADGEVACYPLVENHHREGILRITHAPAPEAGAALQELAERYARLVLERLEYVGVLALELFQVGDRLLANEMAPRVHNSGHWTIEGAETSQFENHLRAVCGLPLGTTAAADAVHDGEPDRRSACDRRAGRCDACPRAPVRQGAAPGAQGRACHGHARRRLGGRRRACRCCLEDALVEVRRAVQGIRGNAR